jgi:hypothetical protein
MEIPEHKQELFGLPMSKLNLESTRVNWTTYIQVGRDSARVNRDLSDCNELDITAIPDRVLSSNAMALPQGRAIAFGLGAVYGATLRLKVVLWVRLPAVPVTVTA